MLNFILGRSKTGKTSYINDLMCSLAKAGDKKLLYIVPDQCSFYTEKTLLKLLKGKLSQNISVLGFSRLCDFVFEKSGVNCGSFADEGIRHVVMSMALEQIGDELVLYKKRRQHSDLTELMLNALKEYKKCSISTDMLYEASANTGDKVLKQKLYETALCCDAYDAILKKSYIDPLDSLDSAGEIIEREHIFDGYTVVVDSFYGFTKQEYGILTKILLQSREMYFTLTTDMADDTDTDSFFVCNRTYKRLKRIADDKGVKCAPVVYFSNTHYQSDDMSAVEENIFRIDKTPSDNPVQNVSAYCACDIYDEADFVAKNITKLVTEQNYTYSQIAVISRDCNSYCGILDNALKKYGISYFMNNPSDIDSKPVIKLVRSCFDTIMSGFEREDVLSLLKTGLTDISVVEISVFENYLFVWNLSGSKLFSEFTANPRGFADEFSATDTENLHIAEKVRKYTVERLLQFKNECENATGLVISKALYSLLCDFHCGENVAKLCDELENDGYIELSKEQLRLYNLLVEILEKFTAVVGDYSISAKRYYDLLCAMFANTDIAFIPRSLDEVDVSQADRARLENKRAVFIIGTVDGEFPHIPVESGVYSDSERINLISMGLPMSDSLEQLVKLEQYLAYYALSCASEKLFVSYYSSDLSGAQKNPSTLVCEVSSAFSSFALKAPEDEDFCDKLLCEKAAFDYFASNYSSKSAQQNALKEYFSSNDEYKDTVLAMQKAVQRAPMQITDKENSKALFGENMMLSPSRIDTFHMCRFEYFCKYGLNVSPRRSAQIDALEYGTLMHYVLEKFISAHKGDNFSTIDEKSICLETASILEEYMRVHLGGIDGKSDRFKYLYYRMRTTAQNLIIHITRELSQSEFKPTDFELKIGSDIPAYTVYADDNLKVSVRGSIDRVDIMKKNDATYIRVIDYKTGAKKFNLSDIMYGLNLQMLIYLSAVCKNAGSRYEGELTPAGILYMPAVAPTIKATLDYTEEKINAEKDKEYRMNGLILDDDAVIRGMERDANGIYIPVSCNSSNERKGLSNLATLEQLGAIFSHIDKTVADMARELIDGDIAAVPIKGASDACAWCKYSTVCGYRESDECKNLFKTDNDKVMEELRRGRADEQNMDA